MDLASMQVLVVDDNRQMRMLVRSVLRAAGITNIVEAENGAQAINAMHRKEVDLAIVDWHMAPENGIALTQRIRGGAVPNPEVPVVMLTAHTERSRVAAARDAGVHGLVCKPISTQLLLERVSAALTDTRPFIRSPTFFGPDRRHGLTRDFMGPFRRATDEAPSDFVLEDDAPLRRQG